MGYLEFIRKHALFAAFGLTMTIGSSYGQTFFVGLFGGVMMQDLGLSHSTYGALYSAATLASGFMIFWAGRLVDVLDLRIFSAAVLLGLAAAAFLTGHAASAAMLAVAFFGLRFFGQGLSSHAAMTAMARYFEDGRGKALSLASLGFPIGNMVWPFMGVAVMGAVGWRSAWDYFALTIALVFVPLVLVFLKGQTARHAAWAAQHAARVEAGHHVHAGDWTRPQVMRDMRYWLVQLMNVAGPFFITGFFFHQVHIAEVKAWALGDIAAAMAFFAGVSFATNLWMGSLVDRITARALVPYLALPLGGGALMLAVADGEFALYLYLLPMAVTAGMGVPVMSSLWAELYGTSHLGAIKAMNSSLMVAGTGLSPFLFGAAFDAGWSVPSIAFACAVWCVVTTAVIFWLRLSGRFAK